MNLPGATADEQPGTRHPVRLDVQYEGTRFHGWQAMPGVRTVQAALQEAGATLVRRPVEVHAAGRTDAGVHALGQVCHIDLDADATDDQVRRWLRGFNALLPEDVAVTAVRRMPAGFHARHSAVGKAYVYRVHDGPSRPLQGRGWVWPVGRRLNVEAMQRAAWCLLGEHDFEAFRAAGCQARHARRYLWRAHVTRAGDEVHVELRGNAFVRAQVRVTVGTLVDVGLGSRDPLDLAGILASRERARAGMTAPPEGLALQRVYYAEDAAEADIPPGARWPGWPPGNAKGAAVDANAGAPVPSTP